MAQSTSRLTAIGRGTVKGEKGVSIVGTNDDIDSAAAEDVWEHGGSVNYLSSASILNITSTDAADASAGTGMRTFRLSGLDANLNEISEEITLNGQTIVTTSKQYLRLTEMLGLTWGSGEFNVGTIHAFTGTATAGTPDDEDLTYLTISPLHGLSLSAIYTVPAGKKAYLYETYMTTDSAAKQVEGKVYIRNDILSGTAGWCIILDFKTDSFFKRTYTIPLQIRSGADIRIECTASANNTFVTAGCELVVVDD